MQTKWCLEGNKYRVNADGVKCMEAQFGLFPDINQYFACYATLAISWKYHMHNLGWNMLQSQRVVQISKNSRCALTIEIWAKTHCYWASMSRNRINSCKKFVYLYYLGYHNINIDALSSQACLEKEINRACMWWILRFIWRFWPEFRC